MDASAREHCPFAQLDFSRFFGFGFYNPSHDNPVQTSNNYDASLEKRLNGTDITFKLSPFYRYTTHQSLSIPLGPNFVSAVNLGTQKSTGVEVKIHDAEIPELAGIRDRRRRQHELRLGTVDAREASQPPEDVRDV